MNRRLLLVCGLAIALVIGLWGISYGTGGAGGKGGDGGRGPRFTVVHSEGFNLIVTDNQSNTLYFYTIDKDAEVGADLKLRGSLDLNEVGKAVLVPKVLKKKE